MVRPVPAASCPPRGLGVGVDELGGSESSRCWGPQPLSSWAPKALAQGLLPCSLVVEKPLHLLKFPEFCVPQSLCLVPERTELDRKRSQ